MLEDALPEEILILSYAYNIKKPRFYSKYFSKQFPNTHNISLANATVASSSAPVFFQPKMQMNRYGHKE